MATAKHKHKHAETTRSTSRADRLPELRANAPEGVVWKHRERTRNKHNAPRGDLATLLDTRLAETTTLPAKDTLFILAASPPKNKQERQRLKALHARLLLDPTPTLTRLAYCLAAPTRKDLLALIALADTSDPHKDFLRVLARSTNVKQCIKVLSKNAAHLVLPALLDNPYLKPKEAARLLPHLLQWEPDPTSPLSDYGRTREELFNKQFGHSDVVNPAWLAKLLVTDEAVEFYQEVSKDGAYACTVGSSIVDDLGPTPALVAEKNPQAVCGRYVERCLRDKTLPHPPRWKTEGFSSFERIALLGASTTPPKALDRLLAADLTRNWADYVVDFNIFHEHYDISFGPFGPHTIQALAKHPSDTRAVHLGLSSNSPSADKFLTRLLSNPHAHMPRTKEDRLPWIADVLAHATRQDHVLQKALQHHESGLCTISQAALDDLCTPTAAGHGSALSKRTKTMLHNQTLRAVAEILARSEEFQSALTKKQRHTLLTAIACASVDTALALIDWIDGLWGSPPTKDEIRELFDTNDPQAALDALSNALTRGYLTPASSRVKKNRQAFLALIDDLILRLDSPVAVLYAQNRLDELDDPEWDVAITLLSGTWTSTLTDLITTARALAKRHKHVG